MTFPAQLKLFRTGSRVVRRCAYAGRGSLEPVFDIERLRVRRQTEVCGSYRKARRARENIFAYRSDPAAACAGAAGGTV